MTDPESERLGLVADYDQLVAERQRLINEGADPESLVVPEFPMTPTRPSDPATDIDVDRLQRAMESAAASVRFAFGDGRVPGFGIVAQEVAREYARLTLIEEGDPS